MNSSSRASRSGISKMFLDSSEASESIGSMKGSPGCFEVVVRRLGAGSGDISLTMDSNCTVLDLKKRIAYELDASNESVPTDRQRLIFFGRMLRDDNESLGETGVNMKTDSTNFVHLTPLPKGAKPSARTSEKAACITAPADPEARLGRSRRGGAERHERRRRRRPEPYATRETRPVAASPVPETQARAIPEQQEPVAYAQRVSVQNHPATASISTSPAAASINQHLQASFSQPLSAVAVSPLTQLSQLSSTIAAATRQAEATTSWLAARFVDQDRQAAAELVPSLSLLHDRLRRFEALPGDEECNLLDTLQLLDHVSRETSNLASTLRTSLIARSHLSSALVSSSQVSLTTAVEQLLRENARVLLLEENIINPLDQLQRLLTPQR